MASVTSSAMTMTAGETQYSCSGTITKIASDARIDSIYFNITSTTGRADGAVMCYANNQPLYQYWMSTDGVGSYNLSDHYGTKYLDRIKNVTSVSVAVEPGTGNYYNCKCNITVNYTANTTSWSSTSTLSLSRSGRTVTATKGGTAVNSLGSSVTYYLYEGSTNKGTFSGNTLTLSNVSDGTHTYKVVASAGGKTADGKSASITVPADAITWSNATLTLAQNDTTVTATKGGTATHNYGTAVTYYLYEGSTKIGTFSGNTLTFTPSVGAHTYKTVASGGGISKDGASASITVVQPHKTLKIYNGSGWIECIIYRYNGSSFIEVEPYYYNGTNWSECSHT